MLFTHLQHNFKVPCETLNDAMFHMFSHVDKLVTILKLHSNITMEPSQTFSYILYMCITEAQLFIDHPSMSVCSRHYREGKLEVVKYLVENSNIDINATDNLDKTPLDYARW